MPLIDTLHTNSKYGVLAISCLIIGGAGLITTLEVFNLYGKVFGFVSGIIFVLILVGVVNSFKVEGFSNYTFEEAILKHTSQVAISVCEVRIKDPVYGKYWFDERGRLIVSQVGSKFFYGWPWINGHKELTINTLDAADCNGVIIDIESSVPPEVTPNGLWIDIKDKAIKIKGNKNLDYQESKAYGSALEMVDRQGQINRKYLGGDIPTLKKTGVTTISLDDLNAREG